VTEVATQPIDEALADKDSATLVMEILFKAPDSVKSPYSRYRALRNTAPRCRIEFPQGVAWVLTGYHDCRHALIDPNLGHAEHRPRLGDDRGVDRPRTMMFMDGPPHIRQRGLVSRAFTPKRVERLRPKIAEHVKELLDRVVEKVGPGGGEIELVDSFAFQLPVAVIGELVGVPAADWPLLRRLTRAASEALELFAGPEVLKRSDAALNEMEEYFRALIAERKARPRDDLISALVQVEQDGESLSVEEIVSVTVLLFGAGFQTATDAIGNGTIALWSHPDQLAKLRADRSLMPSAVEELLRFENPPHLLGRAVQNDTAWRDGTPLAAGENLLILLGAANHDPTVFANPEVLDLARFAGENPPEPPLSFAWGPHHCLGVQLARAELQLAFSGLLDRFREIEVVDDPLKWRASNFRGLHSLNVHLVPA
jgi:cytochrome P450